MKGRLVAFVGVFCIALLIVSGAYAGKPDKDPKEPKSPRPGNIAVECIAFTGPMLKSVEDGTLVVGCCPNAGPSPAYRMALDVQGIVDSMVVDIVDGTYGGYLFAKPVTTRVKGQKTVRYKVQFNTWDWDSPIPPGDDDYFIEVYSDGDDIDETNGVLTVTFNNDHKDDTATIWVLHTVKQECHPTYPYCDDPCAGGFQANCDPFDDDNCYHPCNEEIPIANVSFVMVKTTDLTYSSQELQELGIYCPKAAP